MRANVTPAIFFGMIVLLQAPVAGAQKPAAPSTPGRAQTALSAVAPSTDTPSKASPAAPAVKKADAAAPEKAPAAKKTGTAAREKVSAAKKADTAAPEKAPVAKKVPQKSGKRRDPFNSLVSAKNTEEPMPLRLPPGKRGLVIEQLQLQGIARSIDGSWIAVVDNKTKRAYFLRENDQLYNGVVSKITAANVVFLESPHDALGRVVPREVVKKLAAE